MASIALIALSSGPAVVSEPATIEMPCNAVSVMSVKMFVLVRVNPGAPVPVVVVAFVPAHTRIRNTAEALVTKNTDSLAVHVGNVTSRLVTNTMPVATDVESDVGSLSAPDVVLSGYTSAN